MIGASRQLKMAARLIGLCAVGGLLAGCSGGDGLPRAAVSGSVTLDGSPLAAGTIRFVPLEDTPGQKTSVQITDGAFAAEAMHGPCVGAHRIEIESTDTGGYEMDDEDAIDRLRSERKRRIDAVQVPGWYNDSSNLREEVTSEGPNEFVFELTTKRPR